MMRAVGYGDDDFKQPLVGVAHAWIEIMPCNFNHREQAEWVKEGIREAGGTPVEMNTIAISDGIAMGTEGMKASLVSREVVADSIELVTRGHLLDALVCISGCDKTIPGMVMALARLDLPGLMVYGGSIMPGRFQGKDVTIGDVYEAVGRHAVGKMTDEELHVLACAREAGTPLALQDFDDISARTPLLADMKPWGRFTAVDMDRAGGIMLVLQRLAEAKVLNEHAMTVTGKMIGDEARAAKETHGQEVVRPLANPIAKSGGPIALVRDGDTILIDPESRRIDLQIPDAEVRGRRATTLPPEPRYRTGAMAKYARLVSSASEGAVTGLS